MSDKPYKGRREDYRLLTGRGKYTADHDIAGQAFAYFLRADRAHAKIVRIDTEAARKADGVLGVLTGADIIAAGWKSPAAMAFFKGIGGSTLRDPFRPALAHERVRFVGEPVALVIAESEYQAQDAAELIEVEYEDLPVIVEASDAGSDQAVALHDGVPEQSGAGLRLRRSREDGTRVFRGRACRAGRFARAAHRRQSDGAEILRRAIRRSGGHVRDLRPEPGHVGFQVGVGANHRARPQPLHHSFDRRRWRLWHPERNLSGVPGTDAGGEADRAAGEVDRNALGNDIGRSSCPGCGSDRRAGARCDGPDPRPARPMAGQPWSLLLRCGCSHQHRGGADLVRDQPVQRARRFMAGTG